VVTYTHVEDMERQCLLAANHKNELSEYWQLTCGQLAQPMDVENTCIVFMRYPQSIADADHIVVCTICFNKYKNDPNALTVTAVRVTAVAVAVAAVAVVVDVVLFSTRRE